MFFSPNISLQSIWFDISREIHFDCFYSLTPNPSILFLIVANDNNPHLKLYFPCRYWWRLSGYPNKYCDTTSFLFWSWSFVLAGSTIGENPEEPDHVWILTWAWCVGHKRSFSAGKNSLVCLTWMSLVVWCARTKWIALTNCFPFLRCGYWDYCEF